MGEVTSLTPEDAREVKLPLLPWRRRVEIARYAADLMLPDVESLRCAPKTRRGLEQLASDRVYYDGYTQFHGRIHELEEVFGEGSPEALTIATREMIGHNYDFDQPTIFDKEN